tara:strand:- start:161 stop:463 length:303 start_codon:yes stop_codon:yes gene_type:complete
MTSIPNKRYYTISDISGYFDIEPYKIRYWEKKTGLIKPRRTQNNRRVYTKQDVELIRKLDQLINVENHSIVEATEILSQDFEKYSRLMSMFTKIKTVLCE